MNQMSMSVELKNLRARIKVEQIPKRKRSTIHLLTWNIRNLNKNKDDRAIKYLSEIIKRFDIIAIQETKMILAV